MGRHWTRVFLSHGELVAGGEIVFDMSSTPNPKWGVGPGSCPPPLVSRPAEAGRGQ